jgi:hypothetical protein
MEYAYEEPVYSYKRGNRITALGDSVDFVSQGYHCYQKQNTRPNGKLESFNQRGYFVTNQNKSGLLWMIVEKGPGVKHCRLELLCPAPKTPPPRVGEGGGTTSTANLQKFCRGRNGDYIIKEPEVVGAFRVIPTAFVDIVPSTMDIIGDFNNMRRMINGWNRLKKVKEEKEPRRVSTGAEYEVLASSRLPLPEREGRFLICYYPLQGLGGRNRVKDRLGEFSQRGSVS